MSYPSLVRLAAVDELLLAYGARVLACAAESDLKAAIIAALDFALEVLVALRRPLAVVGASDGVDEQEHADVAAESPQLDLQVFK